MSVTFGCGEEQCFCTILTTVPLSTFSLGIAHRLQGHAETTVARSHTFPRPYMLLVADSPVESIATTRPLTTSVIFPDASPPYVRGVVICQYVYQHVERG